ncbi:MAG: SHD1 domain-containing protein [Pirellulaceae bacterium]
MNDSLLYRPILHSILWVSAARLADTVDAQQTARVWTDSTGRFKITATLVESLDGVVQLRTADGKTLTIPIARLSKADQEFLTGAANPFALGDTADVPMSEPGAVAGSAGVEAWDEPLLIDWKKVRQVIPNGVAGWDVPVVDTQLGFDIAKGQIKKGIIPKESMHSHIAINPRCKRAVVGFSGTLNGKVMSRVTMIDLVSGKSVASQPLEGHFRPTALLDDGGTVVMVGAGKWPRRNSCETKCSCGSSMGPACVNRQRGFHSRMIRNHSVKRPVAPSMIRRRLSITA